MDGIPMKRMHELLTPVDPSVIGWSDGELLFADADVKAQATHVDCWSRAR